jgi:hypothetical protein
MNWEAIAVSSLSTRLTRSAQDESEKREEMRRSFLSCSSNQNTICAVLDFPFANKSNIYIHQHRKNNHISVLLPDSPSLISSDSTVKTACPSGSGLSSASSPSSSSARFALSAISHPGYGVYIVCRSIVPLEKCHGGSSQKPPPSLLPKLTARFQTELPSGFSQMFGTEMSRQCSLEEEMLGLFGLTSLL